MSERDELVKKIKAFEHIEQFRYVYFIPESLADFILAREQSLRDENASLKKRVGELEKWFDLSSELQNDLRSRISKAVELLGKASVSEHLFSMHTYISQALSELKGEK